MYTKILPSILVHKKFPSQNDKLISFYQHCIIECTAQHSFYLMNVSVVLFDFTDLRLLGADKCWLAHLIYRDCESNQHI